MLTLRQLPSVSPYLGALTPVCFARIRRAIVPFTLCFPVFFPQTGRSATFTANSCSSTDVQSAVNSANNGDIVVVPAGTCSWSVSIPSTKGITLSGGSGGTTSVSGSVVINSSSTTPTRVTGFTFTSPGGNGAGDVQVFGSTSSAFYRIDHNTFSNPGSSIFVELAGNGPGLIDHNSFTAAGASEEIHNLAMGADSEAGWQDNITPGSPNMVYIETNTFSTPDPTYICSGIESYYGSRNVLRNNTLNFCQFDQHGTAGMIGARWWEIYNNTFNVPSNHNQCCDIVVRDGTGVIWGNTQILGPNSNGGDIELYSDNSGTWPLGWQIGAGLNDYSNGYSSCAAASAGAGTGLNKAPAYVWGNSSSMPVDTNGNPSNTVFVNQDFFVLASQPSSMKWVEKSGDTCSTTYAYAPFTYPFPLDANGMPNPTNSGPPAAPTNLSAAAR